MGKAAADIGTVGGLAAAMGECLGQATAKDNRRFVTTGFPAKPTRIVWNLVCMGYGPRDAMAIFFWWAATEDGAWSIEHRDKLNGVLDCNDVVDGDGNNDGINDGDDILFVDSINGSTNELQITEKDRIACLAGFMLWVSPLAMSVMCMMYAVILFLMSRVLSTKADKKEFANSAARFSARSERPPSALA